MVIEYNGHSFFETQKGYFLGNVSNTPKWLHRYVWECEKGEIPPKTHIHHIDGDKSNNSIENLCILTDREHLSLHHDSEESKKKARENLKKFAQPKANEWHKSEAGREMARKLYQNSKLRQNMTEKVTMTCQICGKEYTTPRAMVYKSKYCGQNCKATALRRRRKSCQG